MPSYKMTYFNGRGRGEIARMLFAAAGVSYVDDRVEFSGWKELQPKTPLGSLPVLEIDGKIKLVESKAIYRYLAREFNFYGKNNMESTQIDVVCEVVGDMWAQITKANFMKDEKEKEAEFTKLFTEVYPKKMAFLEKFLSENVDGGKSYFAGKSLSLADITFLQFMEYFLAPGKNEKGLDKYPKLKALNERVSGNAKIAAWIKERPTTPF